MNKIPGAFMLKSDEQKLEYEFLSLEARLYLCRLIRERCEPERGAKRNLIFLNKFINLSNKILQRPLYQLDIAGEDDYLEEEYAWNWAEFELIFLKSNTIEMVKILIEAIQNEFLDIKDVNKILNYDNCSFELEYLNNELNITFMDDEYNTTVEEIQNTNNHKNLRHLIQRMEIAYQSKDWPLVLHTGASAFETLAKQIIPNQNIQNQPFGSYFSLFKNTSHLSAPLVDEIKSIYDRRNIVPLSGHGSTQDPNITEEDATYIKELTIALVRLENTLIKVRQNN